MTAQEDKWNAKAYNEVAPFVYSKQFTTPVLSLLAPKSGEKIIDFGCGSGEVSLEIAKDIGDGVVVGLDSSASMIAKAKQNGLEHVHVYDIQSLHTTAAASFLESLISTHGRFDAVFSNAALHWCKADPAGVLEGAKKVLKPGGRFVIEMGGWGNCIGVRSALYKVLEKRGLNPKERDPWFFPSADGYRALLETAGFEQIKAELVPRITPLQGPLYNWVDMFLRTSSFFEGFRSEEVDAMMHEVQDMCEMDCKDPSSERWMMIYIRLRVSAVFPSSN